MSDAEPASLRTPLARARGHGSAREGTAHWWMMRVTSVMLLPAFLYIIIHVQHFLPEPAEWANLAVLLGEPFMSLALILSVVVGFHHACSGVQTIIEDYVHAETPRLLCLTLNKMYFLFAGVACIYAILYIEFVTVGAAAGPA